jgi:hypothetical protein
MIARPPPQGGAPIDKIGGNEESPQALMSLLISDCGGFSLWFHAILFSSLFVSFVLFVVLTKIFSVQIRVPPW